MTEKIGKPKFEVIQGGDNFVAELSITVQNVLKSLPEDAQTKARYEKISSKRSEVILWTNKQLLEYLQGENLFKDEDTASLTWAVIEVTKGKVTPAI